MKSVVTQMRQNRQMRLMMTTCHLQLPHLSGMQEEEGLRLQRWQFLEELVKDLEMETTNKIAQKQDGNFIHSARTSKSTHGVVIF
uniref:Uncharacterized protein n=1 Tax=Ciona savignyi TaxID=51511 RepID=H2YEG6_CIOSA